MTTTGILPAILYGVVSAAAVTLAYLGFKLSARRNQSARLEARPLRYLRITSR